MKDIYNNKIALRQMIMNHISIEYNFCFNYTANINCFNNDELSISIPVVCATKSTNISSFATEKHLQKFLKRKSNYFLVDHPWCFGTGI